MNINTTRYVILDTETTGMNKFGIHYEGHKIIEIGAVEIINRSLTKNKFHVYLNPNRPVDSEAFKIHGISDRFLKDKPVFSDISNKFLSFICGSNLVIHNASFDVGFLNFELRETNLKYKTLETYCSIIDSLKLARNLFPGQRNSLDALCERYFIDISQRNLHNALIDAQILAYVFLAMTGGQTEMQLTNDIINLDKNTSVLSDMQRSYNVDTQEIKSLNIIYATVEEKTNHNRYLELIEKQSGKCLWKKCN
ncbi:DNA polymerase III, epsilon subunit [Candidatus Blochmanniella vafra str. BVAF]|uniref:DNA polymerase III subunit epsilon n=1 Tax=Blochmanniella vafra (strain BVAF) TaxID=859654 RepID=E8Q610_BLOVB|nr:DNA polymerase III subunit epsilon [Candidatus Blochmannia vafer]ADV33626.1 DNA polymerase III, epsilon subunit [Candidatus Blochmannia vafer str. BVAF]